MTMNEQTPYINPEQPFNPWQERDRLTSHFYNAVSHLVLACYKRQTAWLKDKRFKKNQVVSDEAGNIQKCKEDELNRLFQKALDSQFYKVRFNIGESREQLIAERDLAKEQYAEVDKLFGVAVASNERLRKALEAACKHTSPLGTDIDAEVDYWIARSLADEAGETSKAETIPYPYQIVSAEE